MKTLIRCHIMWHLIWVCTVCLWPFNGFPDKNELNSFQICMVVAIETVGVTKQLSVTVEMMDAYPVNVHLVTVAMATTAQDHVR